MEMKKFTVHVSLGLNGCVREREMCVEDDATEEEIEEVANEILHSMIEWSYWPISVTVPIDPADADDKATNP